MLGGPSGSRRDLRSLLQHAGSSLLTKEPRPPALGVWSLSHGITMEVLRIFTGLKKSLILGTSAIDKNLISTQKLGKFNSSKI